MNATPFVVDALLVRVKVSAVLRPTPTGLGEVIFCRIGLPGAVTVRFAVAVPPVPLLLVLTWPVVFVLVPVVVAVTFTLIWQVAPGATPLPPLYEMSVSPWALPDVNVPPQVFTTVGGLSTNMPAGNGSVTAIPASVTLLPAGLPMVIVRVDVAPAAIEVGLNALVIVGVM